MDDVEEFTAQIGDLHAANVKLEKELEESKQLLTTTRTESEAKIDVMTEKVNRMKALLVKSKAMNQVRLIWSCCFHLMSLFGPSGFRISIQTLLPLSRTHSPTYKQLT